MLTFESIASILSTEGHTQTGGTRGVRRETVRRELTGRAVRVQTLILSRMLAPSVRL